MRERGFSFEGQAEGAETTARGKVDASVLWLIRRVRSGDAVSIDPTYQRTEGIGGARWSLAVRARGRTERIVAGATTATWKTRATAAPANGGTPERKKPRQTTGPSRGSAYPTNETREGFRTETARLRDLVAWHFRRRITCRIRSWVGHRLRRFISRIARGIVQGLERRVLCGRIYRIVQRLRRGLLGTREDDHWRSDHS
jgi:hypothetical protein